MNQKQSNRQAGFTLIELLITLAIIAVLVALFLGTTSASSDKKNATAIMKNAQGIISAANIYKSDMGIFSSALEPLWNKSILNAAQQAYWKGPYIDTPARTSGSTPNMDIADQHISGVIYSYARITTTGGSGNCSNVSQVGTNNSGGTDHTIKVAGVPQEVAKIITSNLGSKVCVDSASNDPVNVYFIIQEVWS